MTLKTLGAQFVCMLVNLFLFNKPSNKNINRNKIAIIRLDAIGDYVVFRQCIKALRECDEYKHHEIHLIGNKAYKDIAETFDSEYIDKFIWVDMTKFNKNPYYKWKIINECRQTHYDLALSPVFSRFSYKEDFLIKNLISDQKIGFSGELESDRKSRQNLSNSYYTKIIQCDAGTKFEALRNQEFFEKLCNHNISFQDSKFTIKSENNFIFNLPAKYAVFFIGSSVKTNIWSVENFAKTAEWLKEKRNYEIVLCGGKKEKELSEQFIKSFHNNFTNLVGKTSYTQLISVLNSADLLVSNDTSAVHCAMSSNTKHVVVISNGNTFGRLHPYIDSKYHIVYHPVIEDIINKKNGYKQVCELYSKKSNLNINDISVEKVLKELKRILHF